MSVLFAALVADFVGVFVVFPEAVVEPVLDAPTGRVAVAAGSSSSF